MIQSEHEKLSNMLRQYYSAYYHYICEKSDTSKNELDICSTNYVVYSLMRTNYQEELYKYYPDILMEYCKITSQNKKFQTEDCVQQSTRINKDLLDEFLEMDSYLNELD